MVLTEAYKNAFTEVHTILNYIENEEYRKIPEDVISAIAENRNHDYEYEMNEDVDIFNQPMLPETKAILFNFFRDYWATEEQREKIKRMQREERQKIEEKKKSEYGNYNVFKDRNTTIKSQTEDTYKTALIEVKKENIFIKILNKIKSFFRH